jgi:hypothetical protein
LASLVAGVTVLYPSRQRADTFLQRPMTASTMSAPSGA